jgi:hypothetical protein
MRSGYKELGLEVVKPLQDCPRQPQQPSMAEEKIDEGSRNPFKLLLEEALARQMNEMMDNFSHILRSLPTTDSSSSRDHFGGITPFKVQVSFDILVFEGHIDVDALDKWLNLLEGYFSIHNFFDREKITFALLKVVPRVKDWWETYCEQKATEKSTIFVIVPTWILLGMRLRNNTTLLEATMISIRGGTHCDRKGTRQY